MEISSAFGLPLHAFRFQGSHGKGTSLGFPQNESKVSTFPQPFSFLALFLEFGFVWEDDFFRLKVLDHDMGFDLWGIDFMQVMKDSILIEF